MPKKTKTKKTKRISNKTTKQIVKVIVDNSKRSVRVNSSKTPKAIPPSTYTYAYQPIRPELSGLEHTLYNQEIQRLQNPLAVKTLSNPFVDTTGRNLNMSNVASQTRPDPQLSPSTMATTGIEAMKNYLITNITKIPTKKSYSVEEIERLQPNRISELYAQTKQNLFESPTPTPTNTPQANRFGFVSGGGGGLFGGSSKR